MNKLIKLNSEKDTLDTGAKLAECWMKNLKPLVIYLNGNLGVGKTCFARGFIKYFGFDKVKSPTYTIVESYTKDDINIYHFDLYRINDPEELELIGIRDYEYNIYAQLIEWHNLGLAFILKPDIVVNIKDDSSSLNIETKSEYAKDLLQCIKN